MRRRQQGLTLIELLVAMALIGIIFALVTNWQASTLSISTRTNATSQRLSDLNDMTGYVGDRVRSALRVRVATSGLSVNSRACSAANPCLAVVLPVVTPTGQLTGYTTHVYRIEARSVVSSDDKVPDSWAEANSVVLREYRSTSGSTPSGCTDPASALCTAVLGSLATASTFSAFQPYLVSDYLTPAGELGTGIVPFTYNPATKVVRLAFQSRQQVQGQTQLTPAAAHTLDVQARNVP